ncbi:hypothetical protein EV13_2050 [Prochlorococcus sp. MIT 0702]|nr:hypothetical protein EV13_2050 [Prochlorococcus sp. MIT 0702]KGG28208.1 hypothetical protein EV12_0958 [Prochlorococcus sp. MIT 0701]KGG37259.1 hypothetical protein EV14_0051 [Prochlorococcus sp. MIT 0703]
MFVSSRVADVLLIVLFICSLRLSCFDAGLCRPLNHRPFGMQSATPGVWGYPYASLWIPYG